MIKFGSKLLYYIKGLDVVFLGNYFNIFQSPIFRKVNLFEHLKLITSQAHRTQCNKQILAFWGLRWTQPSPLWWTSTFAPCCRQRHSKTFRRTSSSKNLCTSHGPGAALSVQCVSLLRLLIVGSAPETVGFVAASGRKRSWNVCCFVAFARCLMSVSSRRFLSVGDSDSWSTRIHQTMVGTVCPCLPFSLYRPLLGHSAAQLSWLLCSAGRFVISREAGFSKACFHESYSCSWLVWLSELTWTNSLLYFIAFY